MLWVLWDILLPILLAFLAGLFIGWMFWRWRRSRIDAETLSALRRNTTRLKNDAENLRARNAELSDRLQTASVGGAMKRGAGSTPSGAENGELVKKTPIPDGLKLSPVVADGKIIILKSSGSPELIYFK